MICATVSSALFSKSNFSNNVNLYAGVSETYSKAGFAYVSTTTFAMTESSFSSGFGVNGGAI